MSEGLFLFPAPRELRRGDGECTVDPSAAAAHTDRSLPPESYLLEIARDGISIAHADLGDT